MKKYLKKALKEASTLDQIVDIIAAITRDIQKKEPGAKIGYVSGKVTADGKEHIQKNLLRLHVFTKKISKTHGRFIFSAADIFSDEMYWKLNLPRPIHEDEFYDFWRKVLQAGITDIYMTP